VERSAPVSIQAAAPLLGLCGYTHNQQRENKMKTKETEDQIFFLLFAISPIIGVLLLKPYLKACLDIFSLLF
tara:strand:- start:209 stop:424 length:216 start_codon:yes stop_codon:yes gene_type:complete